MKYIACQWGGRGLVFTTSYQFRNHIFQMGAYQSPPTSRPSPSEVTHPSRATEVCSGGEVTNVF